MLTALALFSAAAVTLPEGAALREEVRAADDRFFTLYFDARCHPEEVRAMIADDLEMYHDKGGVVATDAEHFMADYRQGCSARAGADAWRSRRELAAESLVVDPVPGFGAIEDGDHHVLVLQQDACLLFEMYLASKDASGSGWHATSGARFNLSSNALRTDGFTSLAVLLGAGGVALGFPLADPVVGLVITVAILAVLCTAGRDVFRRLMDGVDPGLVETAQATLAARPGVRSVRSVRMVSSRSVSSTSSFTSFTKTSHWFIVRSPYLTGG